MATVKDIMNIVRAFAPEQHQNVGGYDNVGLLCGNENATVNRVLVCLDATLSVLDEAAALGAELIVSHHPFLYGSFKNVLSTDPSGNRVLKAAKSGISVYSAHTNLDFVEGGINDYVANAMGLSEIEPLVPYISQRAGAGRVGNLKKPVLCKEYRARLAEVFCDPYVRVAGDLNGTLSRVAVLNGGGGGDTAYVDLAKEFGADCLVTADVKHHVAIYAHEIGLTIIEPQHYNMEALYLPTLCNILEDGIKKQGICVEVMQTKSETNPRV